MKPLYSVVQLRAIEQAAAAQLPPGSLMQRAGRAAADATLALLSVATPDARILVLAGPGNNGGDALEAAAQLAQAGALVSVWFAGGSAAPSPERQQALARAHAGSSHFIHTATEALTTPGWDVVLDGLFGIGLKRPLQGALREAVELLNLQGCPVLALDVPSGLDADTGCVIGPGGVAVRASHTLTFIGDKPGLHTCDGQDHAGLIEVAQLEIGVHHFPLPAALLNEVSQFAASARVRRQNSHKGSYGSVVILGGAHGMTGAPVLAGRSALYCGAGKVYVAFLDAAPAYDSMHPELMFRHADQVDFGGAVLVAGPGLGTAYRAQEALRRAIDHTGPLVLDADGLNLVAAEPELQMALAQRGQISILTPHPLEAARLLGVSVAEVQADRLHAARQLAAQMQAIVVLKGSGTIIGNANGQLVVNPTGNPGLASGGTGDVLAGLCGSLLAQGWPGWQAALGAVWLHGSAADALVRSGVGPIGMTAGELIPALRTALNRLPQA